MSETTEEVAELRRRLRELEEALAAVADGDADALVVGPPGAERVVSVSGVDLPYRVMVERLGDGAATVSRDGTVLMANPPFARLLGVDAASLVGWPLTGFVGADHAQDVLDLLDVPVGDTRRAEVHLEFGGRTRDVLVSTTALRVARGSVVCCMLADVTEHRFAVQELAAERLRRQQHDDRLRTALEVNDTIVQGLVTAEMTMDLGQLERTRQLLTATSARARELIGQLTGDVRPGTLRRLRPATIDDGGAGAAPEEDAS